MWFSDGGQTKSGKLYTIYLFNIKSCVFHEEQNKTVFKFTKIVQSYDNQECAQQKLCAF